MRISRECRARLVSRPKVEHAALREDLDLGEEVPDGRTRLVDAADHDALLLRQALHALHHHQRRIAVQACTWMRIVRNCQCNDMRGIH